MASSLRSAAASRIFASSTSSAARLSLRATPTPLYFSSSLKSFAFSSHFSRHQRGSTVSASSSRGFSSVTSPKCAASDPDSLKSAREVIKELLNSKFCHPILVRLGWHDAGTYNENIKEWP